MSRHTSIIVPAAFLVGMGCAGWYMKGSRPAKRPPASPLATFTIPQCINSADNTPMQGPTGTYYLAAGPNATLVLYELDATGSGAEITNYWRDDAGHNFVTYVKGSHGWHYIVPDTPGVNGKRLVYPAGSYTVGHVGNTIRLTGQPAATCELVPQGGSPSAPPPTPTTTAQPTATATATAPPTAAPTTTSPPVGGAACAPGATQECFGVGACRGGQTCLPDGSGWGECDCGG